MAPTKRPPRYDRARAVAELSARDARLRRLIERAGPFTPMLGSSQSPFEALLRSILYQQLHGKAATSPLIPPHSTCWTHPTSSSAPQACRTTRPSPSATSPPKPSTAPSPRWPESTA